MNNSVLKKFIQYRKPGHRSWVLRNGKVVGRHRGDIISPQKRSSLMSRIKGKNTGPEKIVASFFKQNRIKIRTQVKNLPGRPDFVFLDKKIVVFVEGDFWHGWRFNLWKHKLSTKWREKISLNRKRDIRNFRKLRSTGWKVIRIWEHQLEQNSQFVFKKILIKIGNLSSYKI